MQEQIEEMEMTPLDVLANDINQHCPDLKENYCGYIHCVACLANALYNAGYRKQEWISVEERLPECEDVGESEAVLFLTSEGRVEAGYFGRGSVWRDVYFRHYRTSVGRDASTVTHWMPLPPLPKGE